MGVMKYRSKLKIFLSMFSDILINLGLFYAVVCINFNSYQMGKHARLVTAIMTIGSAFLEL